MSEFTKLSELKRRIEDHNSRFAERESAEWFTQVLNARKNHRVMVRFLQELSEDADLYDASRGTYLGAVEHTAPGALGYQRRALDTMERDGKDWAQEQHELNPRLGWGPKENFYINVAVVDFDEEGQRVVKPVILSRPIHSPFIERLIEEYDASEGRGITEKTYWIEKKGTGAQTTWKLTEETDESKFIDISGVEVYDLSKTAVRYVPYSQQQKFYMEKADIAGRIEQLAEADAKKHNISIAEARKALGVNLDDDAPSSEPSRSNDVRSSGNGYGW